MLISLLSFSFLWSHTVFSLIATIIAIKINYTASIVATSTFVISKIAIATCLAIIIILLSFFLCFSMIFVFVVVAVILLLVYILSCSSSHFCTDQSSLLSVLRCGAVLVLSPFHETVVHSLPAIESY